MCVRMCIPVAVVVCTSAEQVMSAKFTTSQKLVKAQHFFQDASKAAKSDYEQSLIHNFAMNRDPKIYQYINRLEPNMPA